MRFDSGRQQFGIINLTVVSDYVRSHCIQEEIIALTWAGSKIQTSCHSSSLEGGWVGASAQRRTNNGKVYLGPLGKVHQF